MFVDPSVATALFGFVFRSSFKLSMIRSALDGGVPIGG